MTQALLDYARSDTHFLLYIYDNLRNELIDKSQPSQPEGDLVGKVLAGSKEEALQTYQRVFYDAERGTGPGGWYNMLIKTPALFSRQQFAVFRAVHQFRDSVARQADESAAQVMRKDVVFSLAREMPQDMASLLGCVQLVSRPMQVRMGELLAIIKKAKLAGDSGPDMQQTLDEHPLTLEWKKQQRSREARTHHVPVPVPAPSLAQVIREEREKAQVRDEGSRAENSGFWGTTIMSVKRRRLDNAADGSPNQVLLAVPMPPLTAEVFENGSSDARAHDPVKANIPYTKERKEAEPEIFTIKQLGGPTKRKAADGEDESTMPIQSEAAQEGLDQDMMDITSTDGAGGSSRPERKKGKKEKRQQRLEGGPSETAFDYAGAPSVLHARQKQSDKKDAPFNPYAKSTNAPKGMRKVQKEIAGKSHTFRN